VSQASLEIQQLKEQLANETRLKTESQKETRDLQTSLTDAKEEILSLKKDIEEHEEAWKNQLDTAEKKLADMEKTYNSFKQLLSDIVAAVWGKFLPFFYTSINFCIHFFRNHICFFSFPQVLATVSTWRLLS